MADQEREDEQEQERNELERQIRTSKALHFMEREFELSTAVVMPVLLKLIKTFDGSWEHIELENYHVLVDAIFQQQESAEIEKAPGPSSSGRKNGKKEKKAGMAVRVSTPRRALRSSRRVESDDSDDNNPAQELVHRRTSNRRTADAFTHAAGMANLERTVAAKRGRPSFATRSAAAAADDDDDPAWEPPLALPAPASRICATPLELQRVGGRLRRTLAGVQSAQEVVGVNKQTQTEAADFGALTYREAAHAIVCYEEPTPEASEPIQPTAAHVVQPTAIAQQVVVQQPLAAVKEERSTVSHVFRPAGEVSQQILTHDIAPLKCLSGEMCNKCEKPKSAVSDHRSGPSRSLVFEPSKVKIEGESSVQLGTPLMCLNPQPLQAVVPTSPQPLALAVIDPGQNFEVMEAGVMEVHTPEPLLLTFPTQSLPDEPVGAEPAEVPEMLVPCSQVQAPIELAVPVPVGTHAGSSFEPEEAPVVENPLMQVMVEVGLFNKVEVEVKIAESSTKVEDIQQPTEDSITDGALAALASYISESDNEDTDMSSMVESRVRTNEPVEGREEGLEQEKGDDSSAHKEPHGSMPHANTSSVAVLPDASSRNLQPNTTILPSSLPAIVPFHEASIEDSEMITSLDAPDANEPNSDAKDERKQSSDPGSSDSSRKRKRMKKHQKEQEVRIPDISRGKEKVPVSLSADPNGKNLPQDFFYIKASVVFDSAHVGISLARVGEDDRCSSCAGNCLDNRTPCECTRLTDGEYAYTVEGYLYPYFLKQAMERKVNLTTLAYCQPGACPVERTNDEPCKGHIQRRFIKECWEKCGCTANCGNRIVQRGLARRLEVFWTEGGKGWGVRTLEHLPAGTFVCEYVGEILTNLEMWHRNKDVYRTAKHTFALQLDADWCSEQILKDEEALCLDGTFYGNVARFINHRCVDSNLLDIPVEIESPDHHYYHLAFFTSREVKANEELTWDYGLDFNDKEHPLQAFECCCGSSFCRGNVEDAGRSS